MEKIHQSSSGSQVYPVFPGVVLHWQRIMNNVLYLKWTVPCRLGGNWAKNLLFGWAVLQVKSPIMACIHLQSLEGGCLEQELWLLLAITRSPERYRSTICMLCPTLRARGALFHTRQHRFPLPIPESATVPVPISHCYWCLTASDDENGESFLLPVTKKSDSITYVIHWCFYSILLDIYIWICKKFG